MPTKTKTKTAGLKKAAATTGPSGGMAPPKKKAAPKPKASAKTKVPTLAEHQDSAIGAIEKGLDLLGEKIGDSGKLSPTLTVHELRDKFDALKHHEPFRVLFALARTEAK